jgi:hypothetical protein
MGHETPQFELARLRKEQNKARQDEVFGGLTPAERTEYDERKKRINELESEFHTSAIITNSSNHRYAAE